MENDLQRGRAQLWDSENRRVVNVYKNTTTKKDIPIDWRRIVYKRCRVVAKGVIVQGSREYKGGQAVI